MLRATRYWAEKTKETDASPREQSKWDAVSLNDALTGQGVIDQYASLREIVKWKVILAKGRAAQCVVFGALSRDCLRRLGL